MNETHHRPVKNNKQTSPSIEGFKNWFHMKFLSFLRKTHGETSTKTLQSKPDHQTSNGSDFVRRLSGKKLIYNQKEDGLEPQQNTDKLEMM